MTRETAPHKRRTGSTSLSSPHRHIHEHLRGSMTTAISSASTFRSTSIVDVILKADADETAGEPGHARTPPWGALIYKPRQTCKHGRQTTPTVASAPACHLPSHKKKVKNDNLSVATHLPFHDIHQGFSESDLLDYAHVETVNLVPNCPIAKEALRGRGVWVRRQCWCIA